MFSNADHALGGIKVIRASAQRPGWKVDLHKISQELVYKARMERWFSQFIAASALDGSVENVLRKLSFSNDAADKVLTYRLDEE